MLPSIMHFDETIFSKRGGEPVDYGDGLGRRGAWLLRVGFGFSIAQGAPGSWSFSSSCPRLPPPPPCPWVRWRAARQRALPDAGPVSPGTSSAELYYLWHLRSCCSTAYGSNCCTSASSSGGLGRGKGALDWCPGFVLEGLGVVYAVVSPTCNCFLWLLASSASPAVWLPLAQAVGVASWSWSCGEAPAFWLAAASAYGLPVPFLATRAALLERGVRAWIGGGGLVLWGVGFHSRSLGRCRFLSLVVATCGLQGWGWGALHACDAAWRHPAFPGHGDEDAEMDEGDGANRTGLRSGVRVATWFVESKANRQACTCKALSCRSILDHRCLRVRSATSTRNYQWYHPACVEGGLGPFDKVEGRGSLQSEEVEQLQAFCDQPGKLSRAEYVKDIRGIKRARRENTEPQVSASAREAFLGTDAGESPDLPEDVPQGTPSAELRNMAWWDSVSCSALEQ